MGSVRKIKLILSRFSLNFRVGEEFEVVEGGVVKKFLSGERILE
jgi:hypothetical protein